MAVADEYFVDENVNGEHMIKRSDGYTVLHRILF